MRYATRLERPHVRPRDVDLQRAKAPKKNGDMPRLDWNKATLLSDAFLFDRPTAFINQPGDEGADGAWQRLVNARHCDVTKVAIRRRNRQSDDRWSSIDLCATLLK